jgi:hypothetical protein
MNLDVTVNVPHVVTVAVKAEQQAQGMNLDVTVNAPQVVTVAVKAE